MAYFSEKPAAPASRKVYVHIMVFTAYRFFDEWFFHDLIIYNNCIPILSQTDLWSNNKTVESNTELVIYELLELLVDFGPAVARNFKSPWHGNLKMVQHSTNEPAVPKQSLNWQIVDAVRFPKLHVRHSFGKGEVGREERDKDIAARPILDICDSSGYPIHSRSRIEHAFVENDLVAKDFDFNGASRTLDDAGENLTHGFRTSLDIHGTDAEHYLLQGVERGRGHGGQIRVGCGRRGRH